MIVNPPAAITIPVANSRRHQSIADFEESSRGQGVKDILSVVVFGGFLRKLGLKGVFIP
jgi:hypothetical protein